MVVVRTDFGNTKESARRERFEQLTGNQATNVQQAIGNVSPLFPGGLTSSAFTFAQLPSASSATGSLAYVTDSPVTAGVITVGGGTNKIIATSNGVNWLVLFDLTLAGALSTAAQTFSQLPAASAANGSLAYVTDSPVTTGLITVGAGTHKVIVISNGVNWIVLFDLSYNASARLRFVATGINFNSANTDNAVSINLPVGVARYQIDSVRINNASASISTATVGVFTATGGGGQTIAANQAITVTATASDANNNSMSLTLTNANTEAYNDATLQVRVGTAQGSAATADVVIYITPLT